MNWIPANRQRPLLIAILRGITPVEIESVGEALLRVGFDAIEVPLNSPEPFESIRLAVRGYGEQALIGAGTVLSAEEVERLADIGASLAVSPNTDRDVISKAAGLGMVSLPGAMTPTEILLARKSGATGVKIFPAQGVGTKFIGDVKSILPGDFPLVAVGGIGVANAREWIGAGADGLGVGGSVYRPGDSADAVFRKASALIDSIGER